MLNPLHCHHTWYSLTALMPLNCCPACRLQTNNNGSSKVLSVTTLAIFHESLPFASLSCCSILISCISWCNNSSCTPLICERTTNKHACNRNSRLITPLINLLLKASFGCFLTTKRYLGLSGRKGAMTAEMITAKK